MSGSTVSWEQRALLGLPERLVQQELPGLPQQQELQQVALQRQGLLVLREQEQEQLRLVLQELEPSRLVVARLLHKALRKERELSLVEVEPQSKCCCHMVQNRMGC